MPDPLGPITEVPTAAPAITGVETALTAFIGTAVAGPLAEPTEIWSGRQFEALFGGLDSPLGRSLPQYFANGGQRAIVLRVPGPCTSAALVGGLPGLELIDYFGLLCIPETFGLPEDEARDVANAALAVCRQRRAFYLLDPPRGLTLDRVADWVDGLEASAFGAIYFPPLRLAAATASASAGIVGPAASLAGVYARTDDNRGVWKAPAGIEATVRGAEPDIPITDAENGLLNPRRVNAIRRFPTGVTVWGARTLRGTDALADDFKYVPVRRLASYVEESIRRGTTWTVFEPNAEPLWQRVRAQVESFLHTLFRQGAFQGRTPREAYVVLCDARTHTFDDIVNGRLNLQLGFAPLKPAEFVFLSLTLTASPA